MASPASIICPSCSAVSYNRDDIKHKYCGRCHAYHEDLAQGAAPTAPPAPENAAQGAAPTAPVFGPLLRQTRLAAGKTMGDLARHLGKPVPYISDVERSCCQPLTFDEITSAAKLFKTDSALLLVAAGRDLGWDADPRAGQVASAASPAGAPSPATGDGRSGSQAAGAVPPPPAAPAGGAAPAARSFFVRTVPHAPPRFWPGAAPALPADRLAEIRAAHAEEVPEGTPPSRMAWHERHQQAHQHRGELLAEVLRLQAGGAAPAVQHDALELELVQEETRQAQRTPEEWLAGHDTAEARLRLGVTPPSPCLCDPCRYARRVVELEGAAAAAPRVPEEPAQGAAPAAAVRLTVDVTDPSAPVVHSSWPLDLSREQLAAARATVRSVSKTLLERLKEQHPTAAAGESTPALATTPSSGPSPAAEDP